MQLDTENGSRNIPNTVCGLVGTFLISAKMFLLPCVLWAISSGTISNMFLIPNNIRNTLSCSWYYVESFYNVPNMALPIHYVSPWFLNSSYLLSLVNISSKSVSYFIYLLLTDYSKWSMMAWIIFSALIKVWFIFVFIALVDEIIKTKLNRCWLLKDHNK